MTLSPQSVLTQLKWRYATKSFDPDRKIPGETWSALREALRLAPSSFGLQPWRFINVADPEIRGKLKAASWNQSQTVQASHFVVLAAKESVTAEEIERWIAQIAKTRGVPVSSLDQYQDMIRGFLTPPRPGLSVPHWAGYQVYLALGQLLTTAAMMGIDACPMEGIDPAEYDSILGLKNSGYTTRVACALGYRSAADAYASAAKVRYDESEVWIDR